MTDQTTTFFDFDDPTQNLIDETIKEKTETDTTKVEEKPKVDENVSFFGEDSKIKKEEEKPEVTSFKDIFSSLVEDGKLTSIEKLEDLPETVDKDSAKSIIEKEIDTLFEQEFTGLMDSLGALGTNFLKYTKDGGNPETFISKVTEKPIVSKLPFRTEEDKESFLRLNYLKFEGKDSDEADMLIKAYKDNGKLDSVAEKLRDKRIDEEIELTKKLANDAKTAKANEISARSKERTVIEDTIKKGDDVLGIQLTNKNKLVSFLGDYKFVDKSINKELTAFDVELSKALTDPVKKLVIADILLNNFNFDKLKIKAKQEITKKIEEQSDKGVKTTSGKTTATAKGLTEFLDLI